MKQSILLIFIAILAFHSSNAQLKIGLTGGADFPKMSIHREYRNDFRVLVYPGFHVGLASECKVNENLSITTDLLLAKKGFQQGYHEIGFPTGGVGDNTNQIEVSLYYIEMPVLLEFKARFDKMNVIFGIGPYVAYGIGGKVNLYTHIPSVGDIQYSENVRWSKYYGHTDNIGESIIYDTGYSQLKRLDYGPAVRFGMEFNSIIFSAEYKYGLHNLMWEYSTDERMNNQNLGFSVKYLFNLKKQVDKN